jgi:hypothetical protein
LAVKGALVKSPEEVPHPLLLLVPRRERIIPVRDGVAIANAPIRSVDHNLAATDTPDNRAGPVCRLFLRVRVVTDALMVWFDNVPASAGVRHDVPFVPGHRSTNFMLACRLGSNARFIPVLRVSV